MRSSEPVTLCTLLLSYLRTDKNTPHKLKVEAKYDSGWRIADDDRCYFKCAPLRAKLKESNNHHYQVTLEKWHFTCVEGTAGKRPVVSMVIDQLKVMDLARPVKFTQRTRNIMEDKTISEAFVKFSNRWREKKLVKEELGRHKKITKVSGKGDWGSGRDKERDHSGDHAMTKEASDEESSPQKGISKGRNHPSKSTKNPKFDSDESLSEGEDDKASHGFACHILKFEEVVIIDAGKSKSARRNMAIDLDKSATLTGPTDLIVRGESTRASTMMPYVMPKGHTLNLMSRKWGVPNELLESQLSLEEIMAGIKRGSISWRELNFKSVVVEAVMQNLDNLFDD